MKKIVVFVLIAVAHAGLAQEKYFYISLDLAKPMSNTSWIGDFSTRGFHAGYRAFITPKFSAGLDVSSNTFDQYHPAETVQQTNGALTTDYFKYAYSYAVTASGQYYFTVGDGERFLPYAGIGLGANHNEYTKYYNIYTDTEKTWGFLARPEAGLLVKFGPRRSVGAIAAVHYDFSTSKSVKFDYSNFSHAGFKVGLIFLSY
jgi:hypothetical protein